MEKAELLDALKRVRDRHELANRITDDSLDRIRENAVISLCEDLAKELGRDISREAVYVGDL